MVIEEILVWLVALASTPPVINLVSNFIAYRKNKKLMDGVKQEIVNTKEYTDLKLELRIAHKENRELKQQLNELLTKIDRVDRTHEQISEN